MSKSTEVIKFFHLLKLLQTFNIQRTYYHSDKLILSATSSLQGAREMSNRKMNSPSMKTNLDDWETDPDFVRDMDEVDQRWGSKRTVGSINMDELIHEVRKDHKIMREKFDHPSQRDHSGGFGGKFGIQHDRKDESAADYDYHEKLSKHTSQEISRKVISSSSSSLRSGGIDEAKRSFLEKCENTTKKSSLSPPVNSNTSDYSSSKSFSSSNIGPRPGDSTSGPSPRFEESSSKRVFKEEKNSSSKGLRDMPPAMKSIQEKINAFKKEFEDIENKVAKKSDLSKVIKKTTNVEKSSNVEYVSRNNSTYGSNSPSSRPTSTSPNSSAPPKATTARDFPKTSIKSLSEKFETLCKEDGDDFRRKTEAKRKEFFNQIKSQVRETRKELDGFETIDDEDYNDLERRMREKLENATSNLGEQYVSTKTAKKSSASPSSRPSSRLSNDSLSSKPKVYTHRETTKEEVVSKVVKENDKIIENETKRNVQKSSSTHGSSDDEDEGRSVGREPVSIKHIERELRTSPIQRTESPVERLKREIPIIEPEVKGAGLMARTLYDYQAAEPDELSFDVDDLITNIEKIDVGWYKGIITYKDGHKKLGLFPSNYVKLLNDSSEY